MLARLAAVMERSQKLKSVTIATLVALDLEMMPMFKKEGRMGGEGRRVQVEGRRVEKRGRGDIWRKGKELYNYSFNFYNFN